VEATVPRDPKRPRQEAWDHLDALAGYVTEASIRCLTAPTAADSPPVVAERMGQFATRTVIALLFT
jgi:hypothetical protein